MGVRGKVEQPVDNQTVISNISIEERRAAEGLDRHVPIILRDGIPYDADLDRFFLDLPLNGVRSPHSLRAYGYDVGVWVRFCTPLAARRSGPPCTRMSMRSIVHAGAGKRVRASPPHPGTAASLRSRSLPMGGVGRPGQIQSVHSSRGLAAWLWQAARSRRRAERFLRTRRQALRRPLRVP